LSPRGPLARAFERSISLSLTVLGWNEHFKEHFRPHAEAGLVPGRVAVEHRGAYAVYTDDGEAWAELAGRLRHDAAARGELPTVGDWVALRARPGGQASVQAVLPRRTKFSRKVAFMETEEQVLAANIDTILVVGSLNEELNLRRIERYLTMAWESGAAPAIVLNKADLCDEAELESLVADVEAIAFGVPVHPVSALDGRGVEELRGSLAEGQTAALLGSSGVGKSTLINRLLGAEELATAEIRSDGRGRHTTTRRELIQLPGGGLVIDTPGMRELQLWSSGDGFGAAFEDVLELAGKCRFNDCSHRSEPGCAVLAAIESGSLAQERFNSYLKLQRELAHLERKQDARLAAKERKKWRAVAMEHRRNPKPRYR
jgi:ribosome biogenesis GTPase / thiamine phosphate phosphatase